MKLATLTLLLLVAAAANSGPVDTELSDDTLMEVETGNTEETPVNMEEFLNDTMDNTTIYEIEEDEEPNSFFLEEVKEYFEQHKVKKPIRVARQSSAALYQGSTIALQTYVRSYWLSCGHIHHCARHPCPRMHMTGNDWNACWGEVFRIYRANGPGPVRVGDLVGLYYPRQSGRWLGCWSDTCGTFTCPGYPTISNGFSAQERWYQCSGEVFKIYAKGKSSGSIINSNDDVSFFYLQQQLWLAQGTGHTHKQPCLGTSRPPSYNTYDGCAWEQFRVWKRV